MIATKSIGINLFFLALFAVVKSDDYDASEQEDPQQLIGRLVRKVKGAYQQIFYDSKPCFATKSNFGRTYGTTTCSCVAQFDREKLPYYNAKDKYYDFNTFLVPKYDNIYFEYKDSNEDAKLKYTSIVLSIRHPKCHKEFYHIHYNVAYFKTEDAINGDRYNFYGFKGSNLRYPFNLMFDIVSRGYDCYAYTINGTTAQMAKCPIWDGKYRLRPTEAEKILFEEGTICLAETECSFSIGSPICCGPKKICYGLAVGSCWDCSSISMIYFNLFLTKHTNLEAIDRDWSDDLVITDKVRHRNKKFWSSDSFDKTSAASSVASFNLITTLFNKISMLLS